jgi:hypothetical protein
MKKEIIFSSRLCQFFIYENISLIIIFKYFQWRSLTDVEKTHYEEKAKKLNEDNAIKAAEEKKLEEER